MTFPESVSRRFLWLPVGLGMGIVGYFSLPVEPTLWALWSSIVGGFGLLILNRWHWRSYLLYLMAWCLLGFGFAALRTHYLATPMLSEIIQDQAFKARIAGVEDRGDALRIYLDHVHVEGVKVKKVRLRAGKSHFERDAVYTCPKEGDVLEGLMTLLPISGPVYPGGLDLRRQGYFEGVSAYGSLKIITAHTAHGPGEGHQDWHLGLRKLRSSINEKLSQNLSSPNSAIAMALITGDRSLIPSEVRQQFVDAGIAHILAISGLHLSLIAGFVFLTVRGGAALIPGIAERFNIKKGAAFISILFTMMYLLISGMGYPAQRAFIMSGIAMVAIMVDRRAITMRTIAFAAFFVLILFPESILTASFQLSFAAVVALIAFYEVGWKPLYEWSRYGGIGRRVLAYFLGIMLTTIVASLATTPYTIVLFNRFTLQAILGNLLAIPLTGFLVMPFAFLSTVSLLVGDVTPLFLIFEESLILLHKIAIFVASLPGAAVLVPSPSKWYGVLITVGGLWLCLWRTRLRLLGFIPIGLSFYFLLFPDLPTILVSTKVLAVRDGKTLHMSTSNGGFEEEIWQRHLGCTHVEIWPKRDFKWGDVLLIEEPREIPRAELKSLLKTAPAYLVISNGYIPQMWQGGRGVIDRSMIKKDGPIFIWKGDGRDSSFGGGMICLGSEIKRPWA